jgi:hypothetical protein
MTQPTPRQFARCDWCKQMVPVASRAEADTWLLTHHCPITPEPTNITEREP